MSIPPIGNHPFVPEFPAQDSVLQAEYAQYYVNFLNNATTPPTQAGKDAANAFLNFLTTHSTALANLAKKIDYQPADEPGMTWENNVTGLKTALEGYIDNHPTLGAVYEFSNDCRIWIGVNIQPEQIVQMFHEILFHLIKTPSSDNIQIMLWFLSTRGYASTLEKADISINPAKMKAAIATAILALQAALNNPNKIGAALADVNAINEEFLPPLQPLGPPETPIQPPS